jgi:YfiH family protein
MVIKEVNGVKFVISEALHSPHAFSTRVGGESKHSFTNALNLAFGRGDDDATVLKNLRKFAHAVGVMPENIVSVPQIHSADVRVVGEKQRGLGYFRDADFSCDGYVTKEKDVALGVKTADCVPILLEARNDDGDVIAVSALHAGWRGTAFRIAERGVSELIALGAAPKNIFAAIGPCIGRCCFEVGGECQNELERLDRAGACVEIHENGKAFYDLAALNAAVLEGAGVPKNNIDICGLCTYCEDELFYSHRRQNGVRGTMLSVIWKK